jgi:hypothetical protein
MLRMARGGDTSDERNLERWAALVHGRGACHHPNGAVRLALSALDVFADEFERHREGAPCPSCARLGLGSEIERAVA